MDITLKHIGLQVAEKDVTSFYIDLLDFKILRSFSLSEDDAYNIFKIRKSVKVLYGTCGETDLELFVLDKSSTQTFSHLCIGIEQANTIVEKANKKGYRTYIRNNQTFFIADSNNNIFEIKEIGI